VSDEYFGPWRLEDIRSLSAVCREALRVGDPISGGLMALPRPYYPDLAAALAALDAHPVYRWMQQQMPLALELVGRSQREHFWLVRTLVQSSAIAMHYLQRPPGDPPTSRDRQMALSTIERLEGYLAAGVITFSNPARREMLFELLTEARVVLWERRSKPMGYPELHGLAATLAGRVSLAERGTAWLTQLAQSAIGYKDFSDETARRYINEAMASQGNHTSNTDSVPHVT
jgi:hypothetical protein